MDDQDRALIALLRKDARQPVSSLAHQLGLSRATVRSRIERLCDEGVIRDFTVTLGRETPDAAVRAITLIEVEGRVADRVARQLLGFPEVVALHSTNGRWDMVAEVETGSLAAFDATLRRIRLVEGVTASETSILLTTQRSGRAAAQG